MVDHMEALFDQEQCEKNSHVTGETFGFIKDLEKVWATNNCYQMAQNEQNVPDGFRFGKENTLLLESEEISVWKCHMNSLIVDKFESSDVWHTQEDHVRDQKAILNGIKSDLFAILDGCDGDVQSYLAGKCGDYGTEDEGNEIKLSKYLRKACQLEPIGSP